MLYDRHYYLPLDSELGARALAGALLVAAEHARPNAKGENRNVHLHAAFFSLLPASPPGYGGLCAFPLIIMLLCKSPSGGQERRGRFCETFGFQKGEHRVQKQGQPLPRIEKQR